MFKITKNEEGFQAMRWLLRARGTDRNEPVFTGVYFDEENIVCSDTKRLHLIPNTTDTRGLLSVVVNTAKEIILDGDIQGQFPPYKAILPKKQNNVITLKSSPSVAMFQIAQKNVCVNFKFLEDALDDFGPAKCVFIDEPRAPIVITGETKTAIIMPLFVTVEQLNK